MRVPTLSPGTFPLYTRHFTSITDPRGARTWIKREKDKKMIYRGETWKFIVLGLRLNYGGPVPPHTTENTWKNYSPKTPVNYEGPVPPHCTNRCTQQNLSPSLDLREVTHQVLSGHPLGLGHQPTPEPSVAGPDPLVPSQSQVVPPASNTTSVAGVRGNHGPVGGVLTSLDWLNLQR